MMKKVAMASPFVPPSASPRFQPKYIPEMTYPTPSPHNMTGPKVRGNALGLFDSWFSNDILKVKGFRPTPRIRGSLIPVSASPSPYNNPFPRPGNPPSLIDRPVQVDPQVD